MSLERNQLERKLKIARKKVRKQQALYDVFERQAQEALKACIAASTELATLQAEKNRAVRREEDLPRKNGPLLNLSRGCCVFRYVSSSEAWPKQFKQVHIHLTPLGDPCRSFNIDLRETGRFGDEFTDDDVAEVLLALPQIEGGEKAVAFFMSWKKP